ncbi:hypothetical protein [Photorhabdus temperata]|uniref:Uncharacterized protein n=1 Tax=Photorhabdus temperata J3 TaxID=1389415 RepID=U7R5E7_PHOTE|nr:hypothetical protein [Photorhabdus temperata]ERT14081.1 hypothetical protein O185_05440 [Photorhabdus temperata J3]
MSKETRQKIVHYKRAVIPNCKSNLQDIVESIISENGAANKVSKRREKINQSDSNSGYRLINRNSTYKTILFGQLILFEQGKSQALMTISDDASFYDINSITSQQIKLETDDNISDEEKSKIKREFIDSILYFGIFKNHFMVVQSSSLRVKDVETHLNWLIHNFGDTLNKDNYLILQDKPTEETIKKITESPVKKINLGSVPIKSETPDNKIHITYKSEVDKKNHIQKVKKLKFMPTGKGGDIIKAAFGENWFNDLQLEDSLDEANLQVNLEITYFRKTTKSGQRVLDTLATSLRNFDDDDIKIELQGGGIIMGKEMRLSGKLSIQYNNGLIDENHLYLQMHKWLISKIEAGEIEVKK